MSALDREGCLACHRYPGLVKFEKPDRFKVLHIDEDKHLASSHGKVDCKQCHSKTVQIPHTNVTEVDCTVKCHLEEKEKINNIDPSYLKNFHKEERFAIKRLDDESSCRVCHPLYPHSANNKVRAFANMHTGFMFCEVCHLTKEHRQSLVYDWDEPEKFEFTGEPYGTHQKKEIQEKKSSSGVVSKMLKIFDEENGADESHRTVHFISRITAYKWVNGKKILAVNMQDDEKASAFLKKEKSLGREERQNELNFFHRDIAKKEISVACDECHSENGILDFAQLGFSDKKVKDLKYMNIKSLITKYDTFYLPNLFGPKN